MIKTFVVLAVLIVVPYTCSRLLLRRSSRIYRDEKKALIERHAHRGMNSHLSGDGR